VSDFAKVIIKCIRVEPFKRGTDNRWNARFEVNGLKDYSNIRGKLGLSRLPIKPIVGKRYKLYIEEI
jgi:hypothetical protein